MRRSTRGVCSDGYPGKMESWPEGGVLLLQKSTAPGPPLAIDSKTLNSSNSTEFVHNDSIPLLPSQSTAAPLGVKQGAMTFDDQVLSRFGNESDILNRVIGGTEPRVASYESNRDELASALVLNLSIFTIGILMWVVWQFWLNSRKGARRSAQSAEAGEAAEQRSDQPEETSVLEPAAVPSRQDSDSRSTFSFDDAAFMKASQASHFERSLGKRNYLTYLLICVYASLTLAIVNYVFLLSHGLAGKILFGGWSIFMVAGEVNMWEIYVLTIVNGCIVCFFSEFFRKLIEVPAVDTDRERLSRTVWMQGLPTHDSMRWWKEFELNKNEIKRVGADLNHALTEFLDIPEPVSESDADAGTAFGMRRENTGSRSTIKETSSDSEQSIILPHGPPPVDLKATQWRCQLDNGNPYYINLSTKATQWQPPPELLRSSNPFNSPVVEEIDVAVVLDGWQEAHYELQQAQEYLSAYADSLEKVKKELLDERISYFRRCFFRLSSSYYEQQIDVLRPRIRKLQQDVEKMKNNNHQISGSAFVTFKHRKYRSLLLEEDEEEKRYLWSFWRHPITYFTFGHPPFASVTLTCESAPHPSDVNWSNLHIGFMRRVSVFWTLSVLLMLLMIFVVTVVRISELVVPMIVFLRKELDELEKLRVWDRYVPDHAKRRIKAMNTDHFWRAMFEQVPTLVLLFINSIVVPEAITNISVAERSAKYSDAELRRLLVNFTFLFTTTVVVPFCNVASMSELTSMMVDALNQKDDPAEHLQNIIYAMPGVFALKYLMNATFLTNINQLLQIPQKAYRFVATHCLAVTERDIQMYKTPWPFYWGYWYAWTLSIFSLGLIMSVVCPSTLPVAALFFYMKYKVDKYNLDSGVYTMGTDLEGSLAVRAVCYLRMVVGMWWFAMGLCSYVFHYFAAAEGLDRKELGSLNRGGAGLMILGVIAMIVSQILKAQHLHSIQRHGIGMEENPQVLEQDEWWLWMAVTLQLLPPERVSSMPEPARSSSPRSDGPSFSPSFSPPTSGTESPRSGKRSKSKEKSQQLCWDGPRILGLTPVRKTRLALPKGSSF